MTLAPSPIVAVAAACRPPAIGSPCDSPGLAEDAGISDPNAGRIELFVMLASEDEVAGAGSPPIPTRSPAAPLLQVGAA